MRLCTRCGINPQRSIGQRWCKGCHAESMRRTRPTHGELSALQRKKSNCRAYANTYQARGHLIPQPCEVCGARDTEKHHDDYDQPLLVRWLCRPDHLALERQKRVRPSIAA